MAINDRYDEERHRMIIIRRSSIFAAAVTISALFAGDFELSPARAKAETALKVEGDFAGKKPGKTANDLSGVACMPPGADGNRVCLFMNDESRQAQFAVLKGTTIVPGKTIDLIGENPGDDVLGVPPEARCPEGEGE